MTGAATSELLTAVTEMLRREGQPKVADELAKRAAVGQRPRPIVMVAGEDKRGKSSLVNALLGRRDLSPVGAEVVTGAPISMFYADPERAAVIRYGENTPVVVDVEQARSLATVQGNPQNRENIRAVHLGVSCPILDRVLLVDTPGVGGLTSGHAELTLQSLQFADALLFVTEGGAQLRRAELEFLRRAASRIDTVIIAITKVDLHRGWRTIQQDNAKILAEQAPRLASCPVVPVSALLALRGIDAPAGDAAAIRAESGLTALEDTLTRYVTERAGVLGDVNVLREMLWPLAAADRGVSERLDSLGSDGTARKNLEAEQARLVALADQRSDWPRRLDTAVRKLTLQRSEDCARGLAEIRRRYDARLKDPTKEDRESLPGELVADLTALAGRLNQDSAKQLIDLVEGLLDDIDTASELRKSIEEMTTDRMSAQLELMQIGTSVMTQFEKLSVLASFSSGRSFSTLLTGSGFGLTAGAFVAPPIGIAIGIGLGGLYAFQAFRARSKIAFATEFRGWMAEQCNQTQVTVNTTFQRDLIDLIDEIRQAVREALADREAQVKASLQESKQILDSEAAARTASTDALVARRDTIRGLQRRTVDLLRSLRPEDAQ
jgi:hypothetical protein